MTGNIDTIDLLGDLQQDLVSEAQHRHKMIAEQNTIAIFAADLEDPMSKNFFEIKRKLELAKLMKEAQQEGISIE